MLQDEYKSSHGRGGTTDMTGQESVTAMPQNVSKNSNSITTNVVAHSRTLSVDYSFNSHNHPDSKT